MGSLHHHFDQQQGHIKQKPVRLMVDLLVVFSRPGELVVDPFSGVSSGVGTAAALLGRHSVCSGSDGAFQAAAAGLTRFKEVMCALEKDPSGTLDR